MRNGLENGLTNGLAYTGLGVDFKAQFTVYHLIYKH